MPADPAVRDAAAGGRRCGFPGDASGDPAARRTLTTLGGGPFSLAQTCGPVAWGGGRWPNVDWIDGALLWVGWEGEEAVWRRARDGGAGTVSVEGGAHPEFDPAWGRSVLGMGEACPNVADEVPAALRLRFPGLRAFAYGSLFDGVVSSIVGQSISVASAAVTGRRLAALFHPGLAVLGRTFWPLPRADQLAHATPALVRTSGVTWRRADALVAAGRAFANDEGGVATRSADELRRWLRGLPLVGPWTAESALLWGLGDGDAYPTGDVALLRAACVAYGRPGLEMKGLDRLAEGWRPHRGWVARLLWTALLGTAPPGGAVVSATL